MKNKLAIVIPAYKIDFLYLTLNSIANQTNKNFTLYIGDDCSPSDIYSIVSQFSCQIDIVYFRFKQNLGSTDLVAQWERCIDMVQDESWIWLFSDDDIMDKNCVSSFFDAINSDINYDLYRFNIDIIDDKNDLMYLNGNVKLSGRLDTYDFFKKRISGSLNSFVVEFIFRKNKFYETGRFQNFDLAWGSDLATWIKISDQKGFYTIGDACIKWRSSGVNISPDISPKIVLRKVYAVANLFHWVYFYFKSKDKEIMFLCYFYMFKRIKYFSPYLTRNNRDEVIDYFCSRFHFSKFLSLFMRLSLSIFSK